METGIIYLLFLYFSIFLNEDIDFENQTQLNFLEFNHTNKWHYQLEGEILDNIDAEIITLDLEDTSKDKILNLKNQGKIVICYFSAGSYEEFRDDSNKFQKKVLGNTLDGWKDEKWLDIREDSLKEIMIQRFEMAKDKNCDAIEVDNVDGYLNKNGFNLNYEDQLKYNIWLSNISHQFNLPIGLKNDLDQIKDLVNYYDFAINEQCLEYDECELLQPFINQNKTILHIEYELSKSNFCMETKTLNGFNSVLGSYDLNGRNLFYCE